MTVNEQNSRYSISCGKFYSFVVIALDFMTLDGQTDTDVLLLSFDYALPLRSLESSWVPANTSDKQLSLVVAMKRSHTLGNHTKHSMRMRFQANK